MVKASQNNPELEPERGLDGTMLWNVLCFFLYITLYIFANLREKPRKPVVQNSCFRFLFCQDVYYKCLMFIGHL